MYILLLLVKAYVLSLWYYQFVQFCRELVGNSRTVGEVVQLQYKEIAKMDVKD